MTKPPRIRHYLSLPVKSRFGPAEIATRRATFPAVVGGPTQSGQFGSLEAAVEACAARPCFFDGWQTKVTNALADASRLYALLQEADDATIERVRRHPVFAGRARAPSTKNRALLAVLLTLKPEKEEHRKLASDYACMLIHAHEIGTRAEDFARVFETLTLKQCKAAVRAKRRAEKPGHQEAIAAARGAAAGSEARESGTADGGYTLRIELLGTSEPPSSISFTVPIGHYAALVQLFASAGTTGADGHVLAEITRILSGQPTAPAPAIDDPAEAHANSQVRTPAADQVLGSSGAAR
jgi:hypothetical protein